MHFSDENLGFNYFSSGPREDEVCFQRMWWTEDESETAAIWKSTQKSGN